MIKGQRSWLLQITGRQLREGKFLGQKTVFGEIWGAPDRLEKAYLRTSLRGQGWPIASPVGAGLLTGAQRGRNWPWSVQPVLMTQRLPDVTSRRGCFALGFACTEYNWSEDGFLYLPRHERRQQLCMPPSGLLHIHHSWPPSLSKEGVNSKSRHDTVRGRAVRTGQEPGPPLLSPPSQGGADVPGLGLGRLREHLSTGLRNPSATSPLPVWAGLRPSRKSSRKGNCCSGAWPGSVTSVFSELGCRLGGYYSKAVRLWQRMSYAGGKGTLSSFSFASSQSLRNRNTDTDPSCKLEKGHQREKDLEQIKILYL